MSYFKNILLFECQPPPPLEKFLYPPLIIYFPWDPNAFPVELLNHYLYIYYTI